MVNQQCNAYNIEIMKINVVSCINESWFGCSRYPRRTTRKYSWEAMRRGEEQSKGEISNLTTDYSNKGDILNELW